jgi:hypothetical protein
MQGGWVLGNRDGMQINHTINRFKLMLKINPVTDSAQIIAQMQITGWLYSRKYPAHHVILFLIAVSCSVMPSFWHGSSLKAPPHPGYEN